MTSKRPVETSQYNACGWELGESDRDRDWDAFLAANSSGHHVQTSLWSKVKSINGWTTQRVKASVGGAIVGGAQVLIRRTGWLGRVGYIPKGPVVVNEDDDVARQLVKQISQIAATNHLRVLFVQPPVSGVVENQLIRQGYSPCPIETAPSATVLVNLEADLDAILSRMTKGMRNGIRRSQKRGITVREGTRTDLPTFHQLLSATGKRRGFSTFELEYFYSMWDILWPSGSIRLFLSELNGQAVSGQLCIAFGDTLVAKQIGWSGEHSRLHPNEALDWFTIKWAKANGYRFYDLEGIERAAAIALINQQPLPTEYANSPTSFKLRFGGEIQLYPTAYCLLANPLLRALYKRFGSHVAKWSQFQKTVSRFRTR